MSNERETFVEIFCFDSSLVVVVCVHNWYISLYNTGNWYNTLMVPVVVVSVSKVPGTNWHVPTSRCIPPYKLVQLSTFPFVSSSDQGRYFIFPWLGAIDNSDKKRISSFSNEKAKIV